MAKKVEISKNKKILDLANSIIVDHTEGSFFTKMASDDGGNHLCVYIDENHYNEYCTKKVGGLINSNYPRLRICNFFVSSDYIETFLR